MPNHFLSRIFALNETNTVPFHKHVHADAVTVSFGCWLDVELPLFLPSILCEFQLVHSLLVINLYLITSAEAKPFDFVVDGTV